jgi:hypothetical protein
MAAVEAPGPTRQRRLRVLDPGGRIWGHVESYTVLWRSAEGRLEGLPSGGLEALPRGTELLAVAPGCRIERVPLLPEGDVFVRLRTGLPVRIRVRWDGRVPDGAHVVGLRLECKEPRREDWARGMPESASLGSEVLDDDLPAPTYFTPIRGQDPQPLLYVSEPGTYSVSWTVDGPDARSSMVERERFEVEDQGMPLVLERELPIAWAEAAAKDMGRRRR